MGKTSTKKFHHIIGLIPIAITLLYPLAVYNRIPKNIPGNILINGISNDLMNKSVLIFIIVGLIMGQVIVHLLVNLSNKPADVTAIGFKNQSEYELGMTFARLVSLVVSIIIMIIAIQYVQVALADPLTLGEYFLPLSVGTVVVLMMIYAILLNKKRKDAQPDS